MCLFLPVSESAIKKKWPKTKTAKILNTAVMFLYVRILRFPTFSSCISFSLFRFCLVGVFSTEQSSWSLDFCVLRRSGPPKSTRRVDSNVGAYLHIGTWRNKKHGVFSRLSQSNLTPPFCLLPQNNLKAVQKHQSLKPD